jgi:hypothetical protein
MRESRKGSPIILFFFKGQKVWALKEKVGH